MAARAITGPVSRRGCVGIVKITNDSVQLMPPLLYPLVYDDIECPCVFELNGHFYLIGSIREDIKVRYWFAPVFLGEYHSFHDDVLLPQGNYAARIVQDGKHLLIYNFFYAHGQINSLRVLPPPKQLETDAEGRLVLKTYYRWQTMVSKLIEQPSFDLALPILGNPTATFKNEHGKWTCEVRSGYEIFLFQKPSECFIWQGTIVVEGMGKLGLVCDMDTEGNGYFISFDVSKGLTKIRTWGFNPLDIRENFIFKDLQTAIFPINESRTFSFRLVRYGSYIELSIDSVVKLTLMDYTFSNKGIGLYSASSVISLQESILEVLPDPQEEYASPEDIQNIIK
jgi:beta-fructofuranosidase